tara:strand:- start:2524 stop:2763 length:240 start_codon:yes stop_codon:yes gene_type:complete
MNKSRAIKREQWSVGHVTFELSEDLNRGNATFALIAGEAPTGPRKALFTGSVQKGMGEQLRCLSIAFDALEQRKFANDS